MEEVDLEKAGWLKRQAVENSKVVVIFDVWDACCGMEGLHAS